MVEQKKIRRVDITGEEQGNLIRALKFELVIKKDH